MNSNSKWIGSGVGKEILGVSRTQFNRYVSHGLLASIDTSFGKVYSRSDVEQLATERISRREKRQAVAAVREVLSTSIENVEPHVDYNDAFQVARLNEGGK